MTTKVDEIIEEIRLHRETHAASLDYDLKRITEDLRRQERASKAEVVKRPHREPIVMPNVLSA